MARRRQNSDPFLVVLVAILIIVFFNNKSQKSQDNVKKTLKYWPVELEGHDNLETVKKVMDRHGHVMVNGSEDWDVLWSVVNPFYNFPITIENLKPHQRVNHFPAMNFITHKTWMTSNNLFPFIPATFLFPEMIQGFRNFVELNEDKKFLSKKKKMVELNSFR